VPPVESHLGCILGYDGVWAADNILRKSERSTDRCVAVRLTRYFSILVVLTVHGSIVKARIRENAFQVKSEVDCFIVIVASTAVNRCS